MSSKAIFSPLMLWKDFDSGLPLRESVVSEEVFDNIVYKNIYFSGRETAEGRVRIHGVYAQAKTSGRKSQSKGAILIIPDYRETISQDIVNVFVKQGYCVLMVDYRGEADCDDYTKYPVDIEYANYSKSGRFLDYADNTAKETCWYEWVAVMKYSLSFLKSQPEVDRIGVLGIKNGANVGWMLCGTDSRVDCFVPLFGAGWRAYKNCFKNAVEDDIKMDEERIRFIAGVEVQAYAQNVKCPVLYLTSTNNSEFDIDRAVDTLLRIPDESENFEGAGFVRMVNYAPRLVGVLDKYCERDIDLFFAKFLMNFKVDLPFEPKLTLSVNGKSVSANLEVDFSDTKRIKQICVYISEGTENPAFRDWNLMNEIKGKSEKVRSFVYKLNGNSHFINAFAWVEYRGGITISSKIISKKIDYILARDNKLIYSAKDKTGSFSVYDVKKYSACGLFFSDENYLVASEGASGISGVSSKYGLISYKVNERFIRLYERSLIMMDVFCKEYTTLNLVLMSVDKTGKNIDYSSKIIVNGACVWQNLIVKCTDFKTDEGMAIRNFNEICAIRLEAEAICIFNNLLLI